MKKIVVSIDFSASSENAMDFAARLALSINASVFLLYTYQIPVSLNDTPVMVIPVEELKNNADTNLGRTKELLQKKYPSLTINTESRLGDVVDELNDLCATMDPYLVVIGKHNLVSGVEKLLFGDIALSIIRHLTVPVITVPDTATDFKINNIAFALDGSEKPLHLQKIREFIEMVRSKLYIIHVETTEKDKQIQLSNILPELNPVYQTIKDEDFTHAIQTYLSSNQIGLLILIPHKHSLVERIFFKTHTASVVEKLLIPVMCIPES
jgi:nucleotide-binding universal stress UspA family protein